jgi:hypothetical protein
MLTLPDCTEVNIKTILTLPVVELASGPQAADLKGPTKTHVSFAISKRWISRWVVEACGRRTSKSSANSPRRSMEFDKPLGGRKRAQKEAVEVPVRLRGSSGGERQERKS